jgi:plastocyanin
MSWKRRPSWMACATLVVATLLAGCGSAPPANKAPVAAFSINPGSGAGEYLLDASASADPEGDPLTYAWDFVVGTAEGKTASITVPVDGNATYPVVLVVRDAKGAFGASLKKDSIVVGNGLNQNPSITLVDASRWVKPGAAISLDASPSVDPDGDDISWEWIWGPYIDFDPTLSDHGDPLNGQNHEAQVFNSGALNPGQSFNQTFDKPGTYNYVCHPHPWMMGRIVVDPSLPAGQGAAVSIEGYAYANKTIRIGPNGTVNWTNRDVDQHTASAMDYTPGLLDGGKAPTFSQSPGEGRHVLRVIATDGKGGRFSASYGLLVGPDAPELVRTIEAATDPQDPATVARPAVGGQGGNAPLTRLFYLNYTANLTGTLTWQDPSGGTAIIGRVEVINVSGAGEGVLVPCQGEKTAEKAEFKFSCRYTPPEKGQKYRLRVVADQGAMDWALKFTYTEYQSAGFADYNAARCHLHPPAPPHCF